MQTTAHGEPRAAHRVNPQDITPHLDTIHRISARLAAGRADREAGDLRKAANAIEDLVRAAWGKR